MAQQEIRPERRRRRWPAGIVILLLALSALLHAARILRARDVRLARERYAALAGERPVAATKERRARFYQARLFLAYPARVSHAAADLARRLDAAAPPLRLLSLQVDPGLHELCFMVTVGPPPGSRRAGQRRLAAFLERLAAVPHVFDVVPATPFRAEPAGVLAFSGRVDLP